jgi:hypothetical protein
MTIGDALVLALAITAAMRPPWRFRALLLFIVCTFGLIGAGG